MSGRRAYGSAHRAVVSAMMRAWSPGDPCARCGHPTLPGDRLDADHDDSGDGYLGLSHASPCQTCGRRCNQRAGGQLAATMRGARLKDRACVVCGIPYHATSGSSGARQETCGRPPCVAELKRRRKDGHHDHDGEPPRPDGREW